LIACYLPDLQSDIIDPLRAAGHSDDAIRPLGEVAR
jgi:mannose-6-phosphate isomerase